VTDDPAAERDPAAQVDPRSTTGAYRILVKRQYGRRKGDKPIWWVLAYHAAKAVLGVAPYVLAALVAKRCGLTFPGSS